MIAADLKIGPIHAARTQRDAAWIVTQEIRSTGSTGEEFLISIEFSPGSAQYENAVRSAEARL
jgi:hypothetical protein